MIWKALSKCMTVVYAYYYYDGTHRSGTAWSFDWLHTIQIQYFVGRWKRFFSQLKWIELSILEGATCVLPKNICIRYWQHKTSTKMLQIGKGCNWIESRYTSSLSYSVSPEGGLHSTVLPLSPPRPIHAIQEILGMFGHRGKLSQSTLRWL